MKITKFPVGNYGVVIDGIDLDKITAEEWQTIGDLHLKNLVTIVRGSNCSVDKFSTLIHQWGPEYWDLKYALLKKYKLNWSTLQAAVHAELPFIEQIDKDILSILYKSNVVASNGKSIQTFSAERDSNGDFGLYGGQELDWHMHSSGTYTFEPAVSLLAGKNVVGTATSFVITANYYEDISDSFRSELDDMIILHKYVSADVDPPFKPSEEAVLKFKMCPVDDTEVPMIIQSAGGIRGLHFSMPTFHRIKGATAAESKKLFDRISKEIYTNKYIYDHWYTQDGDFMTFDNSITLHRRVGMSTDRKIYRIEHTYDNLLDSFYEPFLQEPYAKQHRKGIRDIIRLDPDMGFIKPPFKFKDLL
jgi:alpha-ketoglutarate-dependent taurine dioxygenase